MFLRCSVVVCSVSRTHCFSVLLWGGRLLDEQLPVLIEIILL